MKSTILGWKLKSQVNISQDHPIFAKQQCNVWSNFLNSATIPIFVAPKNNFDSLKSPTFAGQRQRIALARALLRDPAVWSLGRRERGFNIRVFMAPIFLDVWMFVCVAFVIVFGLLYDIIYIIYIYNILYGIIWVYMLIYVDICWYMLIFVGRVVFLVFASPWRHDFR